MIKDIRFRVEKYTKKIITKDLYEKWIKEYPKYSKYSFKEFSGFWKLLADKATNIVCNNSHGIKLPSNLGEVTLKYVPALNSNVNYKNSRILKQPMKHLNLITSGKNGKIVWSILNVRKIHAETPLLAFQACRNFTIKAGKAFKDIPEMFKISRISSTPYRKYI